MARRRPSRTGRRAAAPAAPAAAALALLGALLVGGCGGGTHESSAARAVRTATQDYLRALVHGDYAAACDRLSAAANIRLASRAQRLGLSGTCPAQLAGVVGAMPKPQRDEVLSVARGAKVGTVQVHGANASAEVSATFRGQTHAYKLALQLQGPTWRVDARTSPSDP